MGQFRKSKLGGWHRTETTEMVDIIPRGEEDRHIADELCECHPRLSKDVDQRVMIIHKSWDGQAGFELAGETDT